MGGTTASNTSGTINSSVRANQAYGQSIVSYSGTGSNATVGHGLASAPDMVICRPRNLATHWRVWHEGLTNGTYTLFLNSTGAQQVQSDAFGSLPTSSVFSVAADLNTNTQPYIAYCFHSVTNYSSFGSYSGNGSTTGPVVTTGFSPAFVIIKRTDAVDNWIIMDNTRDPYNPADKWLYPSGNFEEYDGATRELDFLANGFQPKAATTEFNASGSTYIYAAFADTREYAYWYDQSGNNNDWTSEGGLTESDVMVDSPTNNFCVLNPLAMGSGVTLSEGNLSSVSTAWQWAKSTFSVGSGKWYWEINHLNGGADNLFCGVSKESFTAFGYDLATSSAENYNVWGYTSNLGYKEGQNTYASYGATFQTAGDVVGVALDMDAGTITFYKNGASQGVAFSNVTGLVTPVWGGTNASVSAGILNFGSDSSFAGNKTPQGNADSGGIGDFFYPVPSGFLALCTANLPSVDVIPSENFNTVIYAGNGGTQSISVGFPTDFTWLKNRGYVHNHFVLDTVRGAPLRLVPNATDAESNGGTGSITSFTSDGFVLGNGGGVNSSSYNYVSWNWKAGGSASSNSNGTITSQVSANVDAGFSVVSYTGNGSAGATIGHGLGGVIPELVINKRRTSASEWWIVYHSSVCTGDDNWLALNTTGALRSGGESMYDVSGFTSTTFGVNAGSGVNVSGATQISYCFHSVESYSKVGKYVGNGNADGPFVYTGGRPAYVMVKKTSAAESWQIADSSRSPYNVSRAGLNPNTSSAENTTSGQDIDLLSNGFKPRGVAGQYNDTGATYIYLCFFDSPFKHTNAR